LWGPGRVPLLNLSDCPVRPSGFHTRGVEDKACCEGVDVEGFQNSGSPQAAARWYSWMSPPSRSRRSILVAVGKPAVAQYTSDPVFDRLIGEENDMRATSPGRITVTAVLSLIELARRYPGSFLSNLVSSRPRAAVRLFLEIYSRPSLRWDDLSFLRDLTSLPILLKGVLNPDDARAAVEHGVDGVIVSNHGGRQVDGAIASLDALPAIVGTVGREIPILLDSGIRGGADAFKALALGASAVLIARPYAYGLGIAGERGAREVIRNFRAEFDLTMGLAGCSSASEITPSMVTRAD
jgi:lactate 2-monooxygenase